MECLVPTLGGKSYGHCWLLEWLNSDLFPCTVTDDKMVAACVELYYILPNLPVLQSDHNSDSKSQSNVTVVVFITY